MLIDEHILRLYNDNYYMKGRKTPAVAYITRLIRTASKTELKNILQESPLKTQDIKLILDYADGASYKELAAKYNKSPQRINQWKHKIYCDLHFYLVRKLND